ncbi:S8 family peptidase [Luteimonas deserti]|uniref:S8 family serine peptidase n=1 Tax=Luteimonas deserti TaxID=2752306 RepID=A0A7Z0QP17_9GAMM|nr:S8 family peptidase [Luteimonas deserti]NYZ62184.1 S8 family serine peptidase [Luteimonas deserti]
MRLTKHPITLAVASAIALATGAAAASGPATRAPALHAPADIDGGARIIVKYRAGTAEARDLKRGVASVDSAVSRAGMVRTAAARGSLPTNAKHLRRSAVGADVFTLSRRLDRTEMTRLLDEIAADPAVEFAELDRRVHPLLTPNDPQYATYQWNFFNPAGGVRAPAAWDINRGAGVVVAVIDSGILPDHPDIAGNVLEGYDFITDAEVSRRPTNERVPGAFDYGDWNTDATQCQVRNSSWHGTHVAGTVAQVTNNALGGAGLAYESKVLPIRALGRCGGYTSDVADAIVWASGGSVPGVPDNTNPAEVINLSLGSGQACPSITQQAVSAATANGSVVVAAAGNSNANVANFSPASCNGVVAVGATRITGGRASYSNFGPRIDLSAPGGGGNEDTGNDGWDGFILQAVSASTTAHAGTYSYGGKAGTSMASPHVAAVAAMVQSALAEAGRDTLTPAEMRTLLVETARPFPVTIPTATAMGSGIVDAKAALDKALEEPCEVDCAPPAITLVNQVPVRGLSGTGGDTLYAIEVPAGVSGPLSITTSGGTGNVSLHVSRGEVPTPTSFDHRSIRPGNSETVRIGAPAAGTYYVLLSGTYGNVTLQARY